MAKKIKQAGSLVVLTLFLFVSASHSLAEEKGSENIYYFNDFEEKDDVVFLACGNPGCSDFTKAQEERYFIFLSKGLTEEKAYSGVKSWKLDIIPDKGPKKGVWNYWRGPRLDISLSKDKPIHFSGYIYLAEVPKDIIVRFGISYRFKKKDGKYTRGSAARIYPTTKVEKGWLFQQADIYERAKKNHVERYGYDKDDILLEFWYISIVSTNPEGFHGERVLIYIDDVKISSESREEEII